MNFDQNMMTDNPYAPTVTEETLVPRRSMACRFMFLLAAILGVLAGGITALSIYQNTSFATQNGGSLPPYIIVATILDAFCTFLLFFSAKMWRSSNVRLGIAFLVAAVILFFGGPPLILTPLAG